MKEISADERGCSGRGKLTVEAFDKPVVIADISILGCSLKISVACSGAKE